MSWFSKVAWKEGLFLQPQHLQQSDRYLENLIRARTAVMTPYPWGLIELKIDRDLAQQGRIGLRTAVGIMPDGMPFDAPNSDSLPTPIAVPEDAAGMTVWLTLPDAAMNGQDVGGSGGTSAGTRYWIDTETVALETPSDSAAFVKLPVSTTRTKTPITAKRSMAHEGRRLFGAIKHSAVTCRARR